MGELHTKVQKTGQRYGEIKNYVDYPPYRRYNDDTEGMSQINIERRFIKWQPLEKEATAIKLG